MYIIPATAPILLTSDTTFSNYLFIFDAYTKIPKRYGMDKLPQKKLFLVIFSSTLAYTSQLYEEAIGMRPSVSYTPYATSSKEKSVNIITFAQFE